jgi:hypothetical protein
MKHSTLAMYDTEEKYENDFRKNLQDCKSEFLSLFADNNMNANNMISVCAPGNNKFIYHACYHI